MHSKALKNTRRALGAFALRRRCGALAGLAVLAFALAVAGLFAKNLRRGADAELCAFRDAGGLVTRSYFPMLDVPAPSRYRIEAVLDVRGFVFSFRFAQGLSLECNLMQPELGGIYVRGAQGPGRMLSAVDLDIAAEKDEKGGEFCFRARVDLALDVDIDAGRVEISSGGRGIGGFDIGESAGFQAGFSVKEDTRLNIRSLKIASGPDCLFDFSLCPRGPVEMFVLYRRSLSLFFLFFGLSLVLALFFLCRGLWRWFPLAVGLIAVEAFLRLGFPGDPRFSMDALIELQDYNFYTVTSLVRNHAADGEIIISDMSYPPRGEVFSLERAADDLRLLCMGASPAEGHDIARGRVFSDWLARLVMLKTGRRTQAINAAVPNFSLCALAYAMNFRDVLMRARPDVIVVFASFAKLPPGRNAEGLVRYRKIRKLLDGWPGWNLSVRRAYCALEFARPAGPLVAAYDLLCRSFLFFGLEQQRKRLMSRLSPRPDIAVQMTERETVKEFWADTLRLCPDLFAPDAPAPQSLLRAVRELALRMNPEVRIVLVPEPYLEGLPFVSEAAREIFMDMVEDSGRRMRAMAAEFDNVIFIDLEDRLEAEALPAFSDMTHLNERGHEIVGRAVFEALSGAGMLDRAEKQNANSSGYNRQ